MEEKYILGRARPTFFPLPLPRGCYSNLRIPRGGETASFALSPSNIALAEGLLGCFHPRAFPMSFRTLLP